MLNVNPQARSYDQFAKALDEAATRYRLYPPHEDYESEIEDLPIREIRRARGAPDQGAVDLVTIADVRGVLRWRSGPWSPYLESRDAQAPAVRIVRQYRMPLLRYGQTEFLDQVDQRLNATLTGDTKLFFLTPQYELGRVRGRTVPDRGHFLLFVHGAFSSGRRIISQLRSHPEGAAFLRRARQQYDSLLFFEHPTLSAGVLLNAAELAYFFRRSQATVDVISHGRGGLVTRWWLEAFERRENFLGRAVFVGSPLTGSSQNTPSALHNLLELLLNVGRGETSSAVLVPWLEASLSLIRIVASATPPRSIAARYALPLVPGLACQSSANNPEIEWLGELFDQSGLPLLPRYYAISSDFQSTDLACRACQHERANDLLVDTAFMTRLSRGHSIAKDQQLAYEPADGVHHGNYFANAKTIGFLQDVLLNRTKAGSDAAGGGQV